MSQLNRPSDSESGHKVGSTTPLNHLFKQTAFAKAIAAIFVLGGLNNSAYALTLQASDIDLNFTSPMVLNAISSESTGSITLGGFTFINDGNGSYVNTEFTPDIFTKDEKHDLNGVLSFKTSQFKGAKEVRFITYENITDDINFNEQSVIELDIDGVDVTFQNLRRMVANYYYGEISNKSKSKFILNMQDELEAPQIQCFYGTIGNFVEGATIDIISSNNTSDVAWLNTIKKFKPKLFFNSKGGIVNVSKSGKYSAIEEFGGNFENYGVVNINCNLGPEAIYNGNFESFVNGGEINFNSRSFHSLFTDTPKKVENLKGGVLNFRGRGYYEHSLGSLVSSGSSLLLENSGEINFNEFSISPKGMFTGGASGEIKNKNDGLINFIGTEGRYAVWNVAGFNGFILLDYGSGIITNEGTINLNKYGIQKFVSCEGINKFQWINKNASVLNAEGGALFDGTYESLGSTTTKADPIPVHVIDGLGNQNQIFTDHYVSNVVSEQYGNLTLKDDWKKYSHWEDGSTINFTDIAAGTALAESIQSQFESAFGTGINIHFTGTGSATGGGSSTFDMTVVKALIDEGKLASGDVVTSEALTHKDKSFTLSQTGDMTQDTGFMGIHGSKGITVKDGMTLTLMGSQATMAMAVGADTRDAAFVVTDAPLKLENGTLNLGHQALSATEGRLASVTFDDQSSLNVNHGIFSLATLQGEGALTLREGARATVEGELTGGSLTNKGTLTVLGKATLKSPGISSSGFRATPEGVFINEKGGTINFNGGVDVTDFAVLGNREGATINAGHVRVDPMGVIENLEGGTLNYASLEAYGIIRQNGVMNVTGNFTVSDDYETTLEGETKAGVLTVGRRPMQLFRRAASDAFVRNTGKTYADVLDLVSGRILVTKDGILAGRTLRDGAVGSDITVEVGGTFGFSHNKTSLENTLKQYTGSKEKKAILALNTDLHFAKGGSLTVGTVHDDKGTVNLGSDALLLLGTTELHGEALFNGESRQHLHAEEGAVIAMTDNLLWGNHYLMKGFDKASTDDIMKLGVKDKDGHALTTKSNENGIYVTVGSDNILDKHRDYRLINQMNWLLDGHQDLSSKAPDVAFLTAALVDPQGARATDRVEALAMDAGVLAETKRMGDDIQGLMLDHAGAGRVGYGTFWADGLFAKTKSGDFKRASGSSAYDSETTGFAFGLDLPITNVDWRVGAAFSAHRGDLDGQDGLSSDIEGYGFSVYGGRTFDSGFNVTTALSYLTTSHDIAGHNLGTVKADVDANVWVFGGRVAMPFAYKQVWMTPYLGAEVMKLKEDGFTASWQHQAAFRYDDVDATLIRTPLGVKAGTFMPLEWLGHSGTLNWDIDVALVPQFGDKEAEYRVSGVTNGHSDGVKGGFADDWLTTAKLGMSWQGALGAIGIYYGAELGDVRELSHTVRAKAAIYF